MGGNMCRNKLKSYVMLILTGMLIVGGTTACTNKVEATNQEVTQSIANHKVENEEIELLIIQNKAIVANEFMTKHGLAYDKDFWQTKVNGITPEQKLQEVSEEQYKRIQAEKQLAKDWGLEEETSFEYFKEEFENENRKRKEMLEQGKVIYGPKQYSLEQYYAYTNSNRTLRLSEQIIKRGMITEEEIVDYYELQKEQLYMKPYSYELDIIKMGANDEVIEKHHLTLDEENLRTYSKRNPEFFEKAISLKQGEEFRIEKNGNEVYEVTCQEVIENGYVPLEEVEDHVKTNLANEKLNQIIAEMIIE